MAYIPTGALKDVGFFDILAKIQEQMPQAIPFISQPGMLDVFIQALDQGWDPTRTKAAMENTEWWKSSTDQSRQFQSLLTTDPATATQRIEDTRRLIADAEAATGIKLDTTGALDSQGFQFLNKAVQQGWDASRIRYELLAIGGGHGGDTAASAMTVKDLANQYGVPLSDQATMDWATKLAQQAISPDELKGYFVEQAKSLFPGLADALDRGVTVATYAAPYIQLAVQELGINPASVNFTDPKWMQALNQVDPKTGQRTSMSLDDWLKTIRTDPRYNYDQTSQARQSATQLAAQLQSKFGAAA